MCLVMKCSGESARKGPRIKHDKKLMIIFDISIGGQDMECYGRAKSMAMRRAGKARWKEGRGQVIAAGRDQHRGQGRDRVRRNIGHGGG